MLALPTVGKSSAPLLSLVGCCGCVWIVNNHTPAVVLALFLSAYARSEALRGEQLELPTEVYTPSLCARAVAAAAHLLQQRVGGDWLAPLALALAVVAVAREEER
jgi:hypothetical protein